MKNFLKFFSIVGNKYVLCLTIFVAWILFFDRNDLFTQHDRKQELKKLQTSASFYESEITGTRKNLSELNSDPAVLEKMARENFFLKKNGEEVFIVVDSSGEKK